MSEEESVPKPLTRRTTTPAKLIQDITDLVSTGLSLRQACEQHGYALSSFITATKKNALYKGWYDDALDYQKQIRKEKVKELVDVGLTRMQVILEDSCTDPKHEAVQVQAFDKVAKIAGLYTDGTTVNQQINMTPTLPDKSKLQAIEIEAIPDQQEDDTYAI